MRSSWSGRCALVLGAVLLCAPPHAWTQDPLQYQKRANRFEGLKAKPVSGFDIELLSARVDYSDAPEQLGDRFHARFYLDKPSDVYVVVRELDYKHFYWLDKIIPSAPWQAGFGNEFDWPTRDVVAQLDDMRISDLGVVARLGRETPSATERVAPVLFYQTQFPTKANGYAFHFRLREDAKIKGTIYKANGELVVAEDLGKQRGARPFVVKWDAGAASEGEYKLVLSGYLLSNSDPVSQVVQFYHRPAVK